MPGADERLPLLPSKRSTIVRWYLLSILLATMCASLTVFSLYSADLQQQLNLSPIQINIVATSAAMGLYAPVPLVGHIADVSRLSILGFTGSALYLVGYGGSAIIYKFGGSYILLAACFACSGAATACIFVGLLVNCARVYPKSAFLGISLPATSFGLSSIIYATVIPSIFEHGYSPGQLFAWLSFLLLLVGCLAGILPIMCRTDKMPHHAEDCTSSAAVGPTPSASQQQQQQRVLPHANAKSHISRFVRTPHAWLLLSTFLFVTGSLEMYINNLDTIGRYLVPRPSAATQVRVFAMTNTIARFFSGAVVDALHTRPSRVLLCTIGALGLTHSAFAFHLISGSSYTIATAVSGAVYGCSFTLYPIMVSRVWGTACFASYWGMFVAAPAVGALLYGVLLSADLQLVEDYSEMFGFSAIMLSFCFLVVLWLVTHWPGH